MLEINTIHLGDSYKLIKDIPDKSVDLVIIDPPYEIVAGGGGGAFGVENRSYHKDVSKKLNYGIKDEILEQLNRIMKKTNIYLFCNKNQIRQYLNFFDGCNIDILVWHKTNPIPTDNNKYLSDLEYIVFVREDNVPMFNNYSTSSKLYQSPTNTNDKANFEHPTIKPLPLIKNFIINSSQPNDLILDCFSGSGTTCVAAKELNRRFIGIEIDANYHRISVERLNGITTSGQTSIFTDFEQQDIFDFIGDEHGTSDNKGLI